MRCRCFVLWYVSGVVVGVLRYGTCPMRLSVLGSNMSHVILLQ